MADCPEVVRTEGLDSDVSVSEQENHLILENGIIFITFSKPGGLITCIRYGELSNILEVLNKEHNRGYWDLNWNAPNGSDIFDVPNATHFDIICDNVDKVELSFTRIYQLGSSAVPLNIDKRFVLCKGSSGFYSYAIYNKVASWPEFSLNQTRITFKLRKDRFKYMALADTKQRVMPSPDDLSSRNCQQLAFREAVLLLNPSNPALKGEVDDKYQYSCENKDNHVHGWISSNSKMGFWIIKGSEEFCNGGPTKQNLTSHVGPTCLCMFHSAHYAGLPCLARLQYGESWQKVFGPVFIYLNNTNSENCIPILWEDAKQQVLIEQKAWPYAWPASSCYAKAHDRGSISGKLFLEDKFLSANNIPAKFAYIGLANPGELGSWQTESKGYQFWTETNEEGAFNINNVRAGIYDLYGWVPGFLGDYKYGPIIINPGSHARCAAYAIAKNLSCQSLNSSCMIGIVQELGDLKFSLPRIGSTIWEIGIPDRSADEFYIPNANPKYINRLFINHDEKYRQYGLWDSYSELYPTNDLVFNVGKNDWTKDWFFVHACRLSCDNNYAPTTWEVRFNMKAVAPNGMYMLRIAIASATNAALQVRFNNSSCYKPNFDTMQFGKDNAIARHGIHGLYVLWNIDVSPSWLKKGDNALFLTQRKCSGPFNGVMYDYLRLEGPSDIPG